METLKTCRECGLTQLLEMFRPAGFRVDGSRMFHPRCRSCHNAYNRGRYAATPIEKRKARARYKTLHKIGTTLVAYAAKLKEQDFRCGACGATEPGGSQTYFHQDHDHACCPSGKGCTQCHRGLLCVRCNHYMAVVDDPGWLHALMSYRDRYLPDPSVNYV